MKLERVLLLALIALCLAACGQDDDDEDELKPITITPGVAVEHPATPTAAAIEPAVVYDGTRTHLVYAQFDTVNARHDIMYTQKIGAGAFTAPATVFPASTADSRTPHTFLDSAGTLHIVWAEGTSPNREIYYATRNSVGTISTPTALTATAEDEANPRVHVDGIGRVHVVWEGSTTPPNPTTAIFYRRTQGSVFVNAVVLPKVGAAQPAEMPDICVDAGDRIYVVWAESDGTSRNVRFLRSDDGGANFGGVGAGFAAAGTFDMTHPRIEGGLDGEVFLTFIGQAPSNTRHLFATYTRSGGTFEQPQSLLTSDTAGLRDPEIAVFRRADDNFTIVIACHDGTAPGGNIVVKTSHDNGLNYPGDPVNLSQGNSQPATNRRPALSLDDNELVVTWMGEPQGGGIVRLFTSASDYTLP